MDMQVTSDAGSLAVLLDQRSAALVDLRPALANIAAEMDRRTGLSLHESKSQDGERFADLADSTKLARLRKRKSEYKRATKGGKLSAADRKRIAKARRGYDAFGLRDHLRRQRRSAREAGIAAAIAAANFKPLVDTGRGRNSANARVTGGNTIRWSVVEYMVPHIAGGGGRPPQRNYSCFRHVNGEWMLLPSMLAFVEREIHRHVQSGGAS